MRLYGYFGLLLIILAEINFYFVVQPFALWYMSIIWIGYILFIDSIVYKLKKKSLLSSYTKEFAFMCILSIPFWLIFEFYRILTNSWIYVNYTLATEVASFLTFIPSVLETFTLIIALGVFSNQKKQKTDRPVSHIALFASMIVFGIAVSLIPFALPEIGFPFIVVGMLLLMDPLCRLVKAPSVAQKFSIGRKDVLYGLFLTGIIVGFLWEFWNFQAVPKWIYNISYLPLSNVKLFELPIAGYLGYLPLAVDIYLFYVFFRSFIFKKGNSLLEI